MVQYGRLSSPSAVQTAAKFMHKVASVMSFTLMIVAAYAADQPDWAFPVADKVQPSIKQDDGPKRIAGSAKSYTQEQIDDLKNPPDWLPNMHPPMPEVVAHGTATFACGSCHLPIGTGHDESAYLAGLPASYIVSQMSAFKSGARKGFGNMPSIAQSLGDADIQTAAEYFTSLKRRQWVKVVETETVPKTYVNANNMRVALPNGGAEPIAGRLVELPENGEAAIERDPRSSFVAFVPVGSVAKGQALATTGGDKTVPCAACHGETLKGLGDAPPIAGNHVNYLFRQLLFFKTGERKGPMAELMTGVVQNLAIDEMIALAAYVSSRAP
jgi:cytochrome c553